MQGIRWLNQVKNPCKGTICNHYIEFAFEPEEEPVSICYDQGLGATLVQHECETLPVSPAVKRFYIISFENIVCTQSHNAGSLKERRWACRNWEEPDLKLLASRQEPISSRGQSTVTQTHLQPITHILSLTQVKEGYSRRGKAQKCLYNHESYQYHTMNTLLWQHQ